MAPGEGSCRLTDMSSRMGEEEGLLGLITVWKQHLSIV